MEKFSNSKGVGLIQSSHYAKISPTPTSPRNWNLLAQDVSLPAVCINSSKMENNIRWMEEFLRHYPTAKLAPHGKTTMCPKLFKRQLQAEGVWGMTLATVQQVRVAANHGVKNVLLANQLVGRSNMEMIASLMKADPSFHFMCIVDSVQNLQALGTFFKQNALKLEVLLEIGTPENGRTGVRSPEELIAVLQELERWSQTIQLAGIEFFEGVLKSAEAVCQFIRFNVVKMLESIFAFVPHGSEGSPFAKDEIILSGAGSSFFDVVAEELAKIQLPSEFLKKTSSSRSHKLVILLRAGCYLTQDVGVYQAAQDRMKASSAVVASMKSSLVPALQVWAYVQSKPERGLAILGMGRRDVSFDSGPPVPSLHVPVTDEAKSRPMDISRRGWTVTNLMDQHAFMQIDTRTAAGRKEFEELNIGDMIAFDIRHPCTTFDKWRAVLLIDDEYNVVDVLETYF